MKKVIIAIGFAFLFFACKKENPPIDPTLTILKQGTFQDEVHATSGTVKLAEDEAGKLYLVFENFSTDSGPDLYFYLSADKMATDFTEVSSTVGSGDFQLALPAGTDTAAQTYVLVWCKQFSVLFGSAKLE